MWNCFDLECPSEDTCEYQSNEKILRKFPDLVSILTSSAEILTEDHPIWTEIQVFQNVQAKYKEILRCDKSLHLLQRVGTCLRKMVLLNLSRAYLDLAEGILKGNQSISDTKVFPSAQQLEYVLIRTQSAAKLVCEALHYSKETFCFLIQKLAVGHIILHLMMATSVTARVYILFKSLLIQFFELYRKLYSWVNKLKKGSWSWPQSMNLPEDLEEWLKPEVEEIFKSSKFSKDKLDFLTTYFSQKNAPKENSNDDEDSSIVEICESNERENDCLLLENESSISTMDCGVLISRSEEKDTSNEEQSRNQNSKFKKNKLLIRIDNVDSIEELKTIWTKLTQKKNLQLSSEQRQNIVWLFKSKNKKVREFQFQGNKSKVKTVVEKAKLKFKTILGLSERSSNPEEPVCEVQVQSPKLKKAKTLLQLRELFNKLYSNLEAQEEFNRCRRLKKTYKSGRLNVKLLIKNNDVDMAKKLLLALSKVLIKKYSS